MVCAFVLVKIAPGLRSGVIFSVYKSLRDYIRKRFTGTILSKNVEWYGLKFLIQRMIIIIYKCRKKLVCGGTYE